MSHAATQSEEFANTCSTDAKPTQTTAERRRKVLRYFNSPKTYPALEAAVYDAAPSLNLFDCRRILEYTLPEHIDEYTGPDDPSSFRQWGAGWVGRVARLTALVTPLIPELTQAVASLGLPEADNAAQRVLNRLHEFDGAETDAEAVETWAKETAIREAKSAMTLADWIEKHRAAVRAGVIDVLVGCRDLGICDEDGTFLDTEVQALCNETWAIVSIRVEEFLEPGTASLASRLRARARFTAMTWKSNRLAERQRLMNVDSYKALEELGHLAA